MTSTTSATSLCSGASEPSEEQLLAGVRNGGENSCRVSSVAALWTLPPRLALSGLALCTLLTDRLHFPDSGWQLPSRQVSNVPQGSRDQNTGRCFWGSRKALGTRWCWSSYFKDKMGLQSEENMMMVDRWDDGEGPSRIKGRSRTDAKAQRT